jgi:hypothetical protein
MKPKFTALLEVIRAAADLGIGAATTADEVVQSGDDEVMQAFRSLPAAVPELDQIGRLRDQLTTMCDVGNYRYPACAWLAEGVSLLEIEGAAMVAAGTTELVQRSTGVLGAVYHERREVERVGGRWLSLVAGGYPVTINTDREARSVLAAAAVAADEAETADTEPSV